MRKRRLLLSIIFFTFLSFFSFSKGETKKKAILLVSFGTTHKDTRRKTIDAIEKEVKKAFPDYYVTTAYSSRIVIKIIKKKEGKIFLTPGQGLKELAKKGYKTVLVQGTHIMNGIESETLKKEVSNYKNLFDSIQVGSPLLTSREDYERVSSGFKSIAHNLKPHEGVLFIGHGTPHPGGSAYSMLEYVFHANNFNHLYVATIEGYPTVTTAINEMKKNKIKKVHLYPFMVVAGEHAQNDIAIKIKDQLEENNIKVIFHLKGLGEDKNIRRIYLDHIKYIATRPPKKDYLKIKENYLTK